MNSSIQFTGTPEEIEFVRENAEAIGNCERLIDMSKFLEKGFGRPVSLDEIESICYIVSFMLSNEGGWVPTVYTNKEPDETLEERTADEGLLIGERTSDVKLNKYLVAVKKHGWIVEVAEGDERLLPQAAQTLFQIRAKELTEEEMEFTKLDDDAYPDEDVAMTIGPHRNRAHARGVYLMQESKKGGEENSDSVNTCHEEELDR